MQLLPILIAIALGLLALAFVLYPLYRRTPARKDKGQVPTEQGEQGEALSLPLINKRVEQANAEREQVEATLAGREQAARAALQEIELDYQLGNIAEADYRSLRERYVRRALVALKSRYDREQKLDEMIEVQLREMREHDGDEEE
jgi:hypothetical protein